MWSIHVFIDLMKYINDRRQHYYISLLMRSIHVFIDPKKYITDRRQHNYTSLLVRSTIT